jgi:outer membrane protein TolC
MTPHRRPPFAAVRALAALLPLALAAPAAGQDASPEPPAAVRLSLEEARARAAASSPTVEQARAVERAFQADVDVARAARRPQLTLDAAYTRQSDVPELLLALPGAPPRAIFPNIPDNYRTRMGGAVPVYTGGRLRALTRVAEAEAAAARADVVTVSSDLALETTSAYWDLVTARESERVLRESLAAYESHLADARHRFEAGVAARNEVLAVQVERDRAELARVRAANAAEVAEANLRRLASLSPMTRIEIEEPLAAAEVPPREAGGEAAIEPLVQDALRRRPERAAIAERIAAGEAREKFEAAAALPQVTASGGFDYANPNRRVLPPVAKWTDSWDLTLGLSWTVFDGGRRRAATRRASARTDALRHQAEDVDRHIRLEVTQRQLDLAAARRAVAVAAGNVEAARENSRVAAERHQAGVIPSSERLDAEVLQLQAALDHTEALAQLRTVQAALDRAIGR